MGCYQKGGVLGAGPTKIKGGLGCGSGPKRGVFTAAHTCAGHICYFPPPGLAMHFEISRLKVLNMNHNVCI